MNTAFEILVIVLSCLLGIFLILSIVIASMVYKLVKSIKRVVNKGEQLIDSAEEAAEMFKTAAGPVGAVRSIVNIIESISKHKKKGA